jgi:hypothetical protein
MTAGAIYVIALGAMVALFPSEATASYDDQRAPPKLEARPRRRRLRQGRKAT